MGSPQGHPVSPLPLQAVPRLEGWLDPHQRVPSFWGSRITPQD